MSGKGYVGSIYFPTRAEYESAKRDAARAAARVGIAESRAFSWHVRRLLTDSRKQERKGTV